jgi:hypothetical protein
VSVTDQQFRIIAAICIFLVGIIGAWFLRDSIAASGASVLGGILLATILFFPQLGGNGIIRLGPGGIKVDWRVRTDDPIDLVKSSNPTNSTNSADAKRLCDDGREIISAKAKGETVELMRALSCFEKALKLN